MTKCTTQIKKIKQKPIKKKKILICHNCVVAMIRAKKKIKKNDGL